MHTNLVKMHADRLCSAYARFARKPGGLCPELAPLDAQHVAGRLLLLSRQSCAISECPLNRLHAVYCMVQCACALVIRHGAVKGCCLVPP